MRTILLSIGITLLTILGFYSIISSDGQGTVTASGAPINVGYFLVISACFLGAALTREVPKKDSRFKFEIYRQLSRNPQSIDDLMKSLDETMGGEMYPSSTDIQERTIVSMLDQGLLVLRDGRLEIPK